MLGSPQGDAGRAYRSKKRTCIFWEYVSVPGDGRVNEGPRGGLVDVEGEIDGHL